MKSRADNGFCDAVERWMGLLGVGAGHCFERESGGSGDFLGNGIVYVAVALMG